MFVARQARRPPARRRPIPNLDPGRRHARRAAAAQVSTALQSATHTPRPAPTHRYVTGDLSRATRPRSSTVRDRNQSKATRRDSPPTNSSRRQPLKPS